MKNIKALVIGDLIHDIYVFANCTRISPEAPVPVITPKSEKKVLGGMANVANNLAKLGANVSILSVIGDDDSAKFIESELQKQNITCHIIKQKDRKTSTKTRIFGSNQQIVRIDIESTEQISDKLADELFDKIRNDKYDVIIFSDYDKGVVSPYLAQKIIKFAKDSNTLSLADPKKDFYKFKGIDLITPNYKEACEFLGNFNEYDDDILLKSLEKLQKELDLKIPLITLGSNGIAAVYDNKLNRHYALAKEVFDVTGAGDSVISSLSFFLANDFNISKSIDLANKAAAIVVGKIGAVSVGLDEIINFDNEFYKFKNIDEIKQLSKGKKIVFTNGCFDILHYGHLSYLRAAKELGDILVVGLNSDESIKRLKGENRPINNIMTRKAMMCALEFVDYVCEFSEDTPINLIKTLEPDILVKGADYEGKEVVGSSYAKEVKLIEFKTGYSTTNIIEKIKELYVK
ncbi:D-glycero-beta-D-manno-heptose 1-phosphate adenylyltransferase [Campylobacter sp. 2018MI01]|uniref:D-glycero-beta-D-manno-heptose 1-phosphate adenylyltransferase n=1 Tax=Campylobacter sp. 2018MI01 TaxID=2836735 RepID=UPI001BDAD163|nr:D-glycero-beta-D-manno-heptose 1-phosphate adenylyltransferase [Campylobacter sp. 2018MI01]MBT0879141.1 D-glycero-beta-D-manno-heptose 1-phosphate adenylyltransferase [Campylobacter sp. 2018MI01]